MSSTELGDVDAFVAVEPVTGELLELEAATPEALVEALDQIADYLDRIAGYKAEIVGEIARRADRRGERRTELGGYVFEVNPPTVDTYNVGELQAALAPFVADGRLDQVAVERLVRYPQPKRPPPEVAKSELGKLWKSNDRELLAALARVRQRGTPKRTARIVERPINASCAEEPAT